MRFSFAEDVRRFVSEHIHSVEQLEVLLLLRSEPRAWSAEEISRRLFTSPSSAQMRLDDLCAFGLLRKESAQGEEGSAALYRYEARDAGEDATIAAIERAYRERKDAMIQLIFSRPSDTARTFSDAFRLRRDDTGGSGRHG